MSPLKSHSHGQKWSAVFVFLLILICQITSINSAGIGIRSETLSPTTQKSEFQPKHSYVYCDENTPCSKSYEICDPLISRCVENRTITKCNWDEHWVENTNSCLKDCDNCGLDYGMIFGILALVIVAFTAICFCCFRLQGCCFYNSCSKNIEIQEQERRVNRRGSNFTNDQRENESHEDYLYTITISPTNGGPPTTFAMPLPIPQFQPPPPYTPNAPSQDEGGAASEVRNEDISPSERTRH